MPVYHYQAVDSRGRSLKGTMPAPDESSLELKLKEAGLWLTDADLPRPTAPPADALPRRLRRFKLRGRRELIDFCTLMTFQIKAGVPLIQALTVATRDCNNTDFRKVLIHLQRQIESGQTLHEALALYPRAFSVHFVSVLKAGELTSKLPEAFDDLRHYFQWTDQIMADLRQASLYPAIAFSIIAAFAIFLFAFIIPKFAGLLVKLHVQQPLLTQIIFGLGDFARSTWWITAPLLVALVLGIPIGRRLSVPFATFTDGLKLRLPIFGELNLMLALSRFSHNLSILYRSGLPILQALDVCRHGLIGNRLVEEAVGRVRQDVATGSTITEAMRRQVVFPALLLRMVSMGETSGNLDKALDGVSNYYTYIIPRRLKIVFSLLEPMLMVLLIFIVGTVALAIYLPIVSLMGGIR